METISNIIVQWKVYQIQLNPPAKPEVVRRAEEMTGYTFPPDFKAIYLLADGFKDCDRTPNMFSLWPLQRIIDEYLERLSKCQSISTYQQEQAENFVGFCDYLFNCHQIGFFKGRIGIYKSYDEFNPIAQSFSEVLEFISEDANLIY